MKPTTKQRTNIRRLVEKWRPLLYLHKWNFDIAYMKEDEDGKAAEILHTPCYFEGEIRIYPCFFQQSKERHEEILVHELVHAVLGRLDHDFQQLSKGKFIDPASHHDAVESVTQHVTNIVFHNGGWHEKRSKR